LLCFDGNIIIISFKEAKTAILNLYGIFEIKNIVLDDKVFVDDRIK
jgi:hypothetical protein